MTDNMVEEAVIDGGDGDIDMDTDGSEVVGEEKLAETVVL
jgi:hypothetical protein